MKALRTLLAACLGALFLVVGLTATSAGAATTTTTGCELYPAGPGETFAVSTTEPTPGETITVSGADFEQSTTATGTHTVKILLSPPTTVLATLTTNASGGFTAQVTIPSNASGTKTLSVEADNSVCGSTPITIQVQGTSTSGGLPFTGVDILGAVAAALLLIAAGLLLTRGGRQRRATARNR